MWNGIMEMHYMLLKRSFTFFYNFMMTQQQKMRHKETDIEKSVGKMLQDFCETRNIRIQIVVKKKEVKQM